MFRCSGSTTGGSAPPVNPESLDQTITSNVQAADAGTIVGLVFAILGIVLLVCLLAYAQQKGVFSRAFWFVFEGWASWAIRRKNRKLQKEVERQLGGTLGLILNPETVHWSCAYDNL